MAGFLLVGGVMAPVPTQPAAAAPPEVDRFALMGPFERRLRQRLGLYTGIGVQVTMREKANWYVKKFGVGKGILLAAATVITGMPVWAGTTLVTPTNQVWAGGVPRPYCVHTWKVKTTTSIRAGVAVIKDTTDEEFKVAGAAAIDSIGWVTERNWTNPAWVPTAAPTAADKMEVIVKGSGAWVKARNGANIAMGAPLALSSTGRIAAASATKDTTVAWALMDHDGSTTEGDILVVT